MFYVNISMKYAVAIGVIFSHECAAYLATNQFWTFLSRPDLHPPRFNFTTLNESLVSPGYILLTPASPPPCDSIGAGSVVSAGNISAADIPKINTEISESIQIGPYIYDQKGNLVYSGFGSVGAQDQSNLKIAEYNGMPHLTYFSGNDPYVSDTGIGVIMDSAYRAIKTVSPGNGRVTGDSHEFSVINGGKTALITIFQPTPYDLSSYGLPVSGIQPWGWVGDRIFQEVEIETGKVLFEWRALDHIMLEQSYYDRGSSGHDPSDPWDFVHLNSVQKDNSGNYLISGRFLCALLYIDGKDGSIIWELNGKRNQFAFKGFENNTFPFAFQHHARIQFQNETTMILSVFNDGSDGLLNYTSASSGMVMAIDFPTMTCTLLHQYKIYDDSGKQPLAKGLGSIQLLENTNVFIGWGNHPYISEHTADGTVVMQGQFGVENLAFSYRAFKADWVGAPNSTPALWSAADNPSAPTTFYTSWNGATEITAWQFFGGKLENDCMTMIGAVAKTGFETSFVASEYYPWGYSQAVGENGFILGKSQVTRTYVPGQNLTVAPATGMIPQNVTPVTYRHVF